MLMHHNNIRLFSTTRYMVSSKKNEKYSITVI